jgi:hypothetical protein
VDSPLVARGGLSSSEEESEAFARRCQPRCQDAIIGDVLGRPRYSTGHFQASSALGLVDPRCHRHVAADLAPGRWLKTAPGRASGVVTKVRLRWSVIEQIQVRGVSRFCFGHSHPGPRED